MKRALYFLFLLGVIGISGCHTKKEQTIPDNTISDSPIFDKQSEEKVKKEKKFKSRKGQARSLLTGKWIDKKAARKRPFAVMYNNIKIANPQSGISKASILYEAITEGGITRLMGLMEDFNLERIGSIRSCRQYFVDFALEYDAIYAHFGQSKYGLEKLKQSQINNLNGLSGVGNIVYYRDNTIPAPHNAFTSSDKLIKGAAQMNYRTDYKKDYKGRFLFHKKDTNLKEGITAKKVSLEFSSYTTPYFIYDKKQKVYNRFQFEAPHIDANNQKQLFFKNLIVQFVKEWTLDSKGYQEISLENSTGSGYYITNGKAAEITWRKADTTSATIFYDKTGKEILINPGKTYIAIFPSYNSNKVIISNK